MPKGIKGFQKGCIPWNTGMKGYTNKGSFKEGKHYSPETEFKRGNHPHTEFKKGQNIGKNHPGWKGGKTDNNGYIMVLKPKHPFCDRQGRVRRSHLVMEKHLGRYLTKEEVVHHINEIKDDDKIKNLILFDTQGIHLKFHFKNKKSYSKKI